MAKSEIFGSVWPRPADCLPWVRLHDCTVHRMTQTKPAPSSGESRLKRYFGNPNRLKTHARCWTHVIVFSVELVTTRNPMVLFHFGCNVAWQFCTLSPAIERAGYLGDLATIMPTGVAILAELVPRAGRAWHVPAVARGRALP